MQRELHQLAARADLVRIVPVVYVALYDCKVINLMKVPRNGLT